MGRHFDEQTVLRVAQAVETKQRGAWAFRLPSDVHRPRTQFGTRPATAARLSAIRDCIRVMLGHSDFRGHSASGRVRRRGLKRASSANTCGF